MSDDDSTKHDAPGDFTPPKETIGDKAHALARAGLAAVPFVGGSAAEIFQLVIAPPLKRRQQAWMESVSEGLGRLEEEQQCVIEDLKDNDAFIDTVLQASQAAVRTAHDEKREALRNAVLNAAAPNPPDESKQQVFISLVDQFTVWHLRILTFFANPNQWFADNGKEHPRWSIGGSLSQLLVTAYPELQDQRDFYDVVGKELHQRGLFSTDGFHAMMSGQGAMAKRTTSLGDEFLHFITAPRLD
ncbi:MAG: hypothetical protein ACQESR_02510 [Planctomycetota bacterium]